MVALRTSKWIRLGSVLALSWLLGCGEDSSEEAKEVARATRETVVRGVDKTTEATKNAIDRIDMDKVRKTWDSTVKTVSGAVAVGVDELEPAEGSDPLAGAAEAIVCDETLERCTITSQFADRARHHGSAVAHQVRVRPVNGEVRGIRIEAIETGTLAALLGFRTGDVVTHINRSPLGSMQNAMMLYMQIRSADSFTVHYRRGEEERVLVLDVVYPEEPVHSQ